MSCKIFLATFVFTLILAIRWVEPYDLSLAISFWFAGRVVVGDLVEISVVITPVECVFV
jgi:hypothetical protein